MAFEVRQFPRKEISCSSLDIEGLVTRNVDSVGMVSPNCRRTGYCGSALVIRIFRMGWTSFFGEGGLAVLTMSEHMIARVKSGGTGIVDGSVGKEEEGRRGVGLYPKAEGYPT